MSELAGVIAVMIPIVGSIALFTFLAIAKIADSRRHQEEARSKYEFLRKLSEGGAFDVQKYIEYERADMMMRRERRMESLKIAGLVLVGLGVALTIFFWNVDTDERGVVVGIGAIPGFIGLSLFLASWMLGRGGRGAADSPTPRA